jgi:drug/metabolite transporter (DMT)-like permease
LPHPSPLRIHAALFAVAFLFSANYVILKFAFREFSPMTFAWLRTAGAALLLLAIAPRNLPPLTRADHGRLALFAMLGIVINGALFLAGLNFTTVAVAAVLITTIPVFALVGAIAFGQERTTATKVAGIALAGAGALLVVGGEGFTGTTRSLLGALMIVINCLSYALYLVLSKPLLARLGARRVVTLLFAYGAVLLLPFSAWWLVDENWSAVTWRGWVTLVVVVLGPTMGAYLLNAWALRHAESSFVAVYTYVQPVLASALGAIFLGEDIRGVLVIAAVLIFAGVWLAGRAGAGPIAE